MVSFLVHVNFVSLCFRVQGNSRHVSGYMKKDFQTNGTSVIPAVDTGLYTAAVTHSIFRIANYQLMFTFQMIGQQS